MSTYRVSLELEVTADSPEEAVGFFINDFEDGFSRLNYEVTEIETGIHTTVEGYEE